MSAWQWAIQLVESFEEMDEAREALKQLATQEGFLGGRALPASGGKPNRVQAFFVDEEGGDLLPDGLRRVIVPPSMWATLGQGARFQLQRA